MIAFEHLAVPVDVDLSAANYDARDRDAFDLVSLLALDDVVVMIALAVVAFVVCARCCHTQDDCQNRAHNEHDSIYLLVCHCLVPFIGFVALKGEM
jgi:hypothetical protein